MARRQVVDVFAFHDYRQFLRTYYDAGRDAGQAVTLRAFSKRAALRSPNYLKLVMDGARNLSPPMAARFAEAAGLRGEAAEYFCELVLFNQAKTASERGRAYERLRRFPRYRKVHKLDAAQEAYHSSWYLPALRELVAHKDFREDPRWIARQLLPAISSREAERALATLLELDLLRRDESGTLRQSHPLVETPEGPLGHHVISYHRAMLERAAAALDDVPRAEREIAGLTLCVSGAPASAFETTFGMRGVALGSAHQAAAFIDLTRPASGAAVSGSIAVWVAGAPPMCATTPSTPPAGSGMALGTPGCRGIDLGPLVEMAISE